MKKQQADALIGKYLPKVYGFAVTKAFGYDEAEELCADIVCELYRSFLQADAVYNLDGYVWRISMHVYARFVSAKKKHEGVSLDAVTLPFFDRAPEDDGEALLRLRREVSFLTKLRREIVFSYYYESKSIAAIAAAMRLPAGTVKWHLNKARNELKEGFRMERNIGRLGLKPITALGFGHSGNPGANGGPEFYLRDNLNLNIVYSVYFEPKTEEEIAEELGVTPVYIEERIRFLEENGFLVRQTKRRFTTYVKFEPESYSLEERENALKKQYEAARLLAGSYAASVRRAVADVKEVYVPSGNRELLEAAAIFYGVANKCQLPLKKKRNLSKYAIKTSDGGDFIAFVQLPAQQLDTDYVPQLPPDELWACGNMTRWSMKYPVHAWSNDTKFCSREGFWQNNLTADYEYLYEYMTGAIADTPANAEKFGRLRERKYLSDDGRVNIMVVKGKADDFFAKLPALDEESKQRFAAFALEAAEMNAKHYPPQLRDLIISWGVEGFISNSVAVMVMDILYRDGTLQPLTEAEKVSSNLILFTDRLPQ